MKTPSSPEINADGWLADLEQVHREAIQKAKDAHVKGDAFLSGFHSGRAQVLESWIMSAKVSTGI